MNKLKHIKPWYFLILAAIFGVVSVISLRANNQHMVELRDAVYAADKNGSDVKKPLQDLQAYVTTHMNTNLASGPNAVYPPIQLKYTYERLQAAQNSQSVNSQLYNEAQKYCEGQNSTDFSGRNRVPCIEAYVSSHGAAPAAKVPDALYKFSFASPRWSPDLAGWSIILTILSLGLFVITLIAMQIARRL